MKTESTKLCQLSKVIRIPDPISAPNLLIELAKLLGMAAAQGERAEPDTDWLRSEDECL
jgi:hypothetical protein